VIASIKKDTKLHYSNTAS